MLVEVCNQCERHDKCAKYYTGMMMNSQDCSKACIWPPTCEYCHGIENVKLIVEISSTSFHHYAVCKTCFCKYNSDEKDRWDNLTPPEFDDQGKFIYRSARSIIMDHINSGKFDLSQRLTEKVFREVAEELNVSCWDVDIVAKEQRRRRGIRVNKTRN